MFKHPLPSLFQLIEDNATPGVMCHGGGGARGIYSEKNELKQDRIPKPKQTLRRTARHLEEFFSERLLIDNKSSVSQWGQAQLPTISLRQTHSGVSQRQPRT